MNKNFPLVVLAINLTACATLPPLDTPAGHPEVFIPNRTASDVLPKLRELCKQTGGVAASETSNSLVCDRPAGKEAMDIVKAYVEESIPILVEERDSGTKVYIKESTYFFRGPFGTPNTMKFDLTKGNQAAPKMQAQLESIKSDLMK